MQADEGPEEGEIVSSGHSNTSASRARDLDGVSNMAECLSSVVTDSQPAVTSTQQSVLGTLLSNPSKMADFQAMSASGTMNPMMPPQMMSFLPYQFQTPQQWMAMQSQFTQQYHTLAARITAAQANSAPIATAAASAGAPIATALASHTPAKELDTSRFKEWSVADVARWIGELDGGKFAQYSAVFRQNEVEGSHLIAIDKDVLKSDLGVTKLMDRLNLYKHIQRLILEFNALESAASTTDSTSMITPRVSRDVEMNDSAQSISQDYSSHRLNKRERKKIQCEEKELKDSGDNPFGTYTSEVVMSTEHIDRSSVRNHHRMMQQRSGFRSIAATVQREVDSSNQSRNLPRSQLLIPADITGMPKKTVRMRWNREEIEKRHYLVEIEQGDTLELHWTHSRDVWMFKDESQCSKRIFRSAEQLADPSQFCLEWTPKRKQVVYLTNSVSYILNDWVLKVRVK